LQRDSLPYIHYHKLANHIGQLPLTADCAALVAHLRAYPGAERLLPAVEALDGTWEWAEGLRAISAQLHAENPRFDRGLFEEWACENY
jgi:hypothetical protein